MDLEYTRILRAKFPLSTGLLCCNAALQLAATVLCFLAPIWPAFCST